MNRKRLFTTILVIGSVSLFVFAYNRLRVTSIECQSQFGICDEDVLNELNSKEGQTLLHAFSGVRKTLNTHPKVSHYVTRFTNPSSLTALITQRRPQIAIVGEGSSDYYVYSEDGILLDTLSETQLPLVRIQDISVITNEQMIFVIKMAYALYQTYEVKTFVIQNGGIEFELPNSPKIIFPVQGDIDVLLGSLTFVLSQLNTQLEDFRMEAIDFRFNNPVIKLIE